ncbi:uncharacterized protein LOC18426188 isoform X2 [Amborella trichopoda]|uniref:uncharacterized protein LOC18426188 isoform X2 n=1 Tax=Amborella trichopoda TaxID=13333 RepID=UPI0009BCA256|nr:uncharacterized protein LOC18426188 isoform X2 [Amborella trichopoda]|eukprot:XP_020518030.1 uncharacterized protein LOC18426188 isoform X2 [Amborella trichopoda]
MKQFSLSQNPRLSLSISSSLTNPPSLFSVCPLSLSQIHKRGSICKPHTKYLIFFQKFIGHMEALTAYRHLLKAIDKHIGKDGNKRHFRDFVVQEFRKNSKISDPTDIQQKIKLAKDYMFLLTSVHHHQDLLFSYNIAVDREGEMKRTITKSAASVGLQLPDVYQP